MSYYSRNIQHNNDEEWSRTPRRTRGSRNKDLNQDNEHNSNTNNNNHHSTDYSSKQRLPSDSKSPVPRRKSLLVQSMTANFEQRISKDKIATVPPPRGANLLNGEPKVTAPAPVPVINVPETPEPSPVSPPGVKKSGPSARRGKLQREKRQLRQKRRSTGVISLKDAEDDEKEEKEESNQQEPEAAVEHPNTLQVPVAPVPHVPKQPEPTSNGVHISSAHMSSSRRHGKRMDKKKEEPQQMSEAEELRAKLEQSELTISRLRKEFRVMNDELRCLEEENHQLKEDNKMLEDENKTMLRLIRRS